MQGTPCSVSQATTTAVLDQAKPLFVTQSFLCHANPPRKCDTFTTQ